MGNERNEEPLLEEAEDSAVWAQALASAWDADWSDPREDIYSLQDGEPEKESRCNSRCVGC
jgi:hypothetical protein